MKDTILFTSMHVYELLKREHVPSELIARFLLETPNETINNKVYYEAHCVNKYIDTLKSQC